MTYEQAYIIVIKIASSGLRSNLPVVDGASAAEHPAGAFGQLIDALLAIFAHLFRLLRLIVFAEIFNVMLP